MCGIVGIISKDKVNIKDSLLGLLKRLEYRGYDSAGIGFINNNRIQLIKKMGSIDDLACSIKNNYFSHIGLAHTRWATHGKPSSNNAHPFISQNKKWAIVHNGIVENYLELKKELKNTRYLSQTDSEVIAHLLEKQKASSDIEKVINVCNKLKGSFALLGMLVDKPNTLFIAKRKSPIYIMEGNLEVIVASDTICFEGKGGKYYTLNDEEFCVASLDKLTFYDKAGHQISKHAQVLDNLSYSLSKNEYKHFMLKEIMEESDVVSNIIKEYSKNRFTEFNKKFLEKVDNIVIIGCGTAYHAGLIGARFFEKHVNIDSTCEIASEFRYSDKKIKPSNLYIFISQSGETADTLACLELVKRFGGLCVGITNVMHSTLAKNVDICLNVCAGIEVAVASTKAYIAQLVVLYMLSRHFEGQLRNLQIDYMKDVEKLRLSLQKTTFTDIDKIASLISKKQSVIFIGRDIDYSSSLEASLKLKEVSYISSFACPSGELKHGYLAQVDSNVCVIVLATNQKLLDKTLNNASEVEARGGKVVICSPFKTQDKFIKIEIQDIDSDLICCLVASKLQYLAYKTSIIKNINPDKPRNLAKSVTVE